MLIQCLIEREGPTHINLERFAYVFKERPELTEEGSKAKVAQVLSRSHQEYFLNLPDFKKYEKEAEEEHDQRGAEKRSQKKSL